VTQLDARINGSLFVTGRWSTSSRARRSGKFVLRPGEDFSAITGSRAGAAIGTPAIHHTPLDGRDRSWSYLHFSFFFDSRPIV
jgi:hypothetical protein